MALFKNPYLFLTLAMLGWSGNILLSRAMHAELTPIGLSFWRWSLALTIMLPLTLGSIWRHRGVIAANWRKLALLGLFGTTLFNLTIYQAVQTTTATNAALIHANTPVFIVLVSWLLLGDRITARQALGVAGSMVGVMAVVLKGDPQALIAMRFTPGDWWALASVPVWGIYTLLLRHRPPELSPLSFQAVLVTFGWLPLLPMYLWESAATGGVVWNANTLITVGYIGIVASIISFLFWNAGVPAVGPNKAGLFSHLYPLFTAILAVIFLGETLQFYHLAGVLLIGAGLYLVSATSADPQPLKLQGTS